jgi:hypothetical protein
MSDGLPPGPPRWDNLLYLLAIAMFGWFGDWLRSKWQNKPKPPPHQHQHRRQDDGYRCDECGHQHHHHRDSDEDEEG